jgi:hypothetical protein
MISRIFFAATFVFGLMALAPGAHALTTITTCAELQAMDDDVTEDYVLGNDIDCTGHDPDGDGSGFDPVGGTVVAFEGTFDGAGYTISGLTINRPGKSYAAIFEALRDDAIVENVTISSPSITGEDYVGVLAGTARQSTIIRNITITSPTVIANEDVGALVGHVNVGTVAISDITLSSVDVTGATYSVGGAIGSVLGSTSITDMVVTGDVEGLGLRYHGGIFGSISTDGELSRVWFNGTVTGNDYVGGIAGRSTSGDLDITDVYVRGTITGDSYVGGIIGHQAAGNLLRSYSTADVVVGGFLGGGTIGDQDGGCTDVFLDADEASNTDGNCHTEKTTVEMLDVATYTDTSSPELDSAWDFVSNPNNDAAGNDYWAISSTVNNGYPYLVGVGESLLDGYEPPSPSSGSTTQTMPEIVDPFISIADLPAVLTNNYFDVNWEAGGFGAGFVNAYLSIDAGENYSLIESNINSDNGSTRVLAPSNPTTARIKLVLHDLVHSLVSVESNSFSVIAPQTVEDETDANSPASSESVDTSENVVFPDGIEPGDVIKLETNSAVYQVLEDGSRRVFIDTKTYFTWHNSFDRVKTVSPNDLSLMPLSGLMLPQSGVVLVKIQSLDSVYVLTHTQDHFTPQLREIPSEEVAAELFGDNWADYVIDIAPTFFSYFEMGDTLSDDDVVDTSMMKKREDLNEVRS